MENLVGQIVEVIVSKNGKLGSKSIKVCKVKARSVLFIEVDKPNRKNIFWKVDRKHIETVGEKTTGEPFMLMVDGYLLSENKWESEWDSIGNFSRMAAGSFAYTSRPNYSNHSKGWAPTIKTPQGVSMDALAVSVSNRSTTNSTAGFPMV
jgi:hypothetical protein